MLLILGLSGVFSRVGVGYKPGKDYSRSKLCSLCILLGGA